VPSWAWPCQHAVRMRTMTPWAKSNN
jgi:hypothetical protein